MVHKEFADIFHRFVRLPIIQGSFAEKIYHKFEFLPGHLLEKNHSTVVLRYKIEKDIINMNGSVHGGALATLLDCATTIAILRGDKNLSRTVRSEIQQNFSIDLGLSFISPAKLNDSILIQAVCQKVGKQVAYSVADIYVENTLKLITTGRHVKAVLPGSFFDADFQKIS